MPLFNEPNFDIKFCRELKHYNPLPVNALVFSPDGQYLVSGGDDEIVYVWNMQTFEREQTIRDLEGQITSLIFMNPMGSSNGALVLCIGTGRGSVTLVPMDCRRDKPFLAKQSSTYSVFTFNDSVEMQAYDHINSRFAVASHSGVLKVFSVDKLSLKALWSGTVNNAIPSGIFFYGDKHQDLLSLTLESAQVCCWNSLNGDVIWKKSLAGGIGAASLSEDQSKLLVNNLSTGYFDLYRVADLYGLQSFPTASTRRFIKQCRFLEGTRLAICGSDTNVVHVVDIVTNDVVDALLTGQETDNMTQTVATTSNEASHVFIAGASGGSVFVWERSVIPDIVPDPALSDTKHNNALQAQNSSSGPIILLVFLLTYNSWSPNLFSALSIIYQYYKNMGPAY